MEDLPIPEHFDTKVAKVAKPMNRNFAVFAPLV
jgi:hypothetical protein